MLGLGSQFPTFSKTAVVSLEQGKEFSTITSEDHKKDGKWLVMFWWPKDFTFVCPTEIAEFNRRAGDFSDRDAVLIGASTDSEIAEFNRRAGDFADRDASLIGASTDSEFVHAAWRRDHDDLRGLKFPMLADTSKSLAEELGILTEGEKVAYRVTYIADQDGVIRWVSANDLSVGRNVDEVLRVLDALQTDELCPCNWKAGDATL
jgi:peroxiredoxin (alkyl hydroperoxide reductase subunit C)